MKYTHITAAMALMALASCGQKDGADTQAAATDEEEVAIIEVDMAHRRAVDLARTYTANVEADNVNNIAPAMSNRIQSIRVDVGDHVSRGQLLVTLDAANADQQRINIEQVERDYNRALKLLEIGAGTQSSVDQLKSQLDALRAQYRNTMQNTELTSPISGVVIARNYDPGDMTGAQPVLTVGQITPNVKVMINVNEADISVVKKGMPVEIELDAFPGETFSGRITRVAPAVDSATRTFPVEVLIANPGGKILPGMFARVQINLGQRENVVVPDRAVVKQSGSAVNFVYTYANGTVQYKRVELGQRIDDSFELLSGIEDGDTVVVAGQIRLVDGAKARINQK